jgi:hypothetical protein
MKFRFAVMIGLATSAVGLLLTSGPLSAQQAWRQLFNGKDLTGWTVSSGAGGGGVRAGAAGQPGGAMPGGAPGGAPGRGAGRGPALPMAPNGGWTIEDGALVGALKLDQRGAGLSTVDKFKDFELDLDFTLAEHGSGCSAELIGPNQENASTDKSCAFNSGIMMRTGYQLNLGRNEGGEYIGVVVHRQAPGAIRGNVLWLDTGDKKFPNLRKKQDWNHLNIVFNGDHLTVTMNGTQICDVHDSPAEPTWKDAAPVSFQFPSAGEAGGFAGFVKFRNIRIREL